MRVRVCWLEELANPGAREFSAPGAVRPDDYFVVRRGDALACCSNFCPHMGNRLNWAPNRFLSRDGSLILCPAHGAIYDPTSGECRGGPCNGRALTRWPVAVCDGLIMADVPPAAGNEPHG